MGMHEGRSVMPGSGSAAAGIAFRSPRSILARTSGDAFGAHLCAELCSATSALVYRLGGAPARPDRRDALEGRLVELPREDSGPGLGLSTRDRDALAESVEVIIDSEPADDVHHLISLAERRAELTGRRPLICAVFRPETSRGATSDDSLAWVKLQDATAGGMPVVRIQTGLTVNGASDGRSATPNLLAALQRVAASTGTRPRDPGAAHVELADVAARAVVALALREDAAGQVFTLTRRQPVRLDDVFDAVERSGTALTPVPLDSWLRQLDGSALASQAARLLVGPGSEPPPTGEGGVRLSPSDAGVDEAPLDPGFFDRMAVGRTVEVIPAPRARDPRPEPETRAAVRFDGHNAPLALEHREIDPGGAAAASEAAGYGAFWVPEQRFDPLLALTVAAGTTKDIGLGTAVTVALARSPMTVACSANDLHRLSGGRLVLGLGSQLPVHLANRMAMPGNRPVDRMRDFIGALRSIWASWNDEEPLAYRGEFYSFTLSSEFFNPPPNPHGAPAIFLGAAGPRMAELAGEIADGLIAPPFASRRHLTDLLLPAVERGLAKAGRSRESFTVVAMPLIATGRTPQERDAVESRLRRLVAFYCSPKDYRRVLDLHGLAEFGDTMRELSLSGDPQRWRRMGEMIDDEVLETFAVRADPHDVGDAVLARFGGLADRVVLPAPHGAEAGLWHPETLRLDRNSAPDGRR
ncbi:probable F420-dependent oxidoreductase, MSMEG_2256 family [Saccharopolyspora kobensis]|uniref:Probable F420-dependent oxidoreductase, MSMEG_2256 family n=1 Tax=Saccharopolyspora kobensis TaxID=146035 RepID=A0A1H6A6H9_9PSEU|nr:probable F420-dependent oxidoreductase, MSMEG_2256 family [Saccharopolyspora kobensis]SFE51066.1 probable F420-dependent oxidoreductase, MSMEG_2256 family [Saccharopolyspora kobensis]